MDYVLARRVPAHAVIVTTGRYLGGGVALAETARERAAEAVKDGSKQKK